MNNKVFFSYFCFNVKFDRLNVCIGKTNERWFFAALLFSLFCLLYGVLLTMTTVCHPRIVHILMLEILIPFQCSNVYFDLR